MNEKPIDNVIDFTAEAMRRLDSNAVSLEAKRHIIDLLRRKQMVVGVDEGRDSLPSTVLDLKGQNEIIYYALLLKDPAFTKWDPESGQPRPDVGWIDISHPKVRAAHDLLQAYPEKMGNTPPEKEVIDASRMFWTKANDEQRSQLVRMLLIDPSVDKWISHAGDFSAPDTSLCTMQLDNPTIFGYLPPEWQVYVEEKRRMWNEKNGMSEQRSS